MTLFIISFIAGVLTALAPCILPLLPVVVGSSVGRSKASPYIVIGSLALSILLFTYLLKASTALIAIPTSFWGYLSGSLLVGLGILFIFPDLWGRIPFVAKTNTSANKILGTGYQKKSFWGDIMIGAALGPVFSSCSPTYFVILATVLPASFFLGTLYLLAYIAGLVCILALIALLGQRITSKLQFAADSHGWTKRIIGGIFILIGLFIFTGFDKKIETWVLDKGYIDGVLQFEQNLLETAADEKTPASEVERTVRIPVALERNFTTTDFSNADPALSAAISGGPPKDGIPALDTPSFVPLVEFDRPDDIQTITITSDSGTKVYPYNILTWHEIVNDTIDGVPIAVTFCPLCGSAIVFNRTLPDGTVSTFGVSGSLLESNMIMFDRATESLWQQSTGAALAGEYYPAKLTLESFQLLTLGQVRNSYPDAFVLSEETGFDREYGRNPYAGYETDDRFVFEPSGIDTTYEPKTIMVVVPTNNTVLTVPWLELREQTTVSHTSNNSTYIFTVSDEGELVITDESENQYPFYFEMWFSVAVQHKPNTLEVLRF